MHVTVEEISPVEKKLAISIEWPVVAAKLDEAYRELGRGVTLKGFRKGKVPRNILERMYARQVESDVKQRLVQESFVRAVQKHELKPVVEPVVDEMKLEKGQGFAFSARVEVAAEFEAKDYFGIALEREKPQVTDEEVEQALKHKQRELTELKKIDGRGELRVGDLAFVDVHGQLGAHPFKRDGAMVELGAESQREVVPGLSQALVGLPLDAADRDVTFTIPAALKDDANAPAEIKDLAGTEVTVKVTVREAREKHEPALDDDFAKDTGEADSLAELRDKMRARVAEHKARQDEQRLRGELVKKALEKNPFEVAPALVDRQVEMILRRTKMQLMMQGVNPDQVNLDERQLAQSARPLAVEEVRSYFLVDAVARQEKVEVTEADLEKKLAEMARERNKNLPRLKAELQKENKLDQIRYQLREEKTIDLLMSRANISDKP